MDEMMLIPWSWDYKVTTIEIELLDQLRARGGTWAVYRNEVMDSVDYGRTVALQVGPGCTHETPPKNLPDGEHGIGWKYLLAGMVDMETGELINAD